MITGVGPTSLETTYLFRNMAIVARLPVKCSRHNTTSRSHSITKIVKNICFTSNADGASRDEATQTQNVVVSILATFGN